MLFGFGSGIGKCDGAPGAPSELTREALPVLGAVLYLRSSALSRENGDEQP